jgi:hypothetical protein
MMEVESNLAEKFDPISELPDDLAEARVIAEVSVTVGFMFIAKRRAIFCQLLCYCADVPAASCLPRFGHCRGECL